LHKGLIYILFFFNLKINFFIGKRECEDEDQEEVITKKQKRDDEVVVKQENEEEINPDYSEHDNVSFLDEYLASQFMHL
jgi:hypothetical protein